MCPGLDRTSEAAARGVSSESLRFASTSLAEERDIPRMECPLRELRRCPDPGREETLAVPLGRLQR